jgi:alkanesulfonate monooxygenase SsuD/methylene tetrahydromethanopterin reductase-like flavin-dependent oxidoreductase (luciferase family)
MTAEQRRHPPVVDAGLSGLRQSRLMPVAGLSVVPYTDSLPRIRELVQVADDGGLELVGIQDHPYQGRFLDTFSLIATLLAETRRLSFFTDVANLPLRPPAVLAKAAASLDVISGGRFELGLGCRSGRAHPSRVRRSRWCQRTRRAPARR